MNGQSGISGSLTRKVGPLPVWAWALIAGIGLYVIRNRSGAGGVTASQAAMAQSAQNQNQLAPVTLSPGETVYDPNTGALMGGSVGGGGNNGGPSFMQLIAALAGIEALRGGHGNTRKRTHHHNRHSRHHHHHGGRHPHGGGGRGHSNRQQQAGHGRKWGRPHGHGDPTGRGGKH